MAESLRSCYIYSPGWCQDFGARVWERLRDDGEMRAGRLNPSVAGVARRSLHVSQLSLSSDDLIVYVATLSVYYSYFFPSILSLSLR